MTKTENGGRNALMLRRSQMFLATIRGCLALGVSLIAAALHSWGAREIRQDPSEVIYLTLAGGVWLLLCQRAFFWLGLGA